MCLGLVFFFFFFKQKTAYGLRISDWSSDVCSSDLLGGAVEQLLLALEPLGGQPPVWFHDGEPAPALTRGSITAPPVVPSGAMAASTRAERIADRERNPKWQNPPLLIAMSICINCDTCISPCPPHFGAIFNPVLDVVLIPELCSGCS